MSAREFFSLHISSCQVWLAVLCSSECICVSRWGTRALFEAQLCEDVRILNFSCFTSEFFFVSLQQQLCAFQQNHARWLCVTIKTLVKPERKGKAFAEANNLMFWHLSVIMWFVCPEQEFTFTTSCTALYTVCVPHWLTRLCPRVTICVLKKVQIHFL